MNYFPFTFNFVPLMKEWVLSGEYEYPALSNPFPSNKWTENVKKIVAIANEELRIYGLPDIISLNVFRKPCNDIQKIHVDYMPLPEGVVKVNAAYNIPVINNEMCIMKWYGGEYELRQQLFVQKIPGHQSKKGVANVVEWKNDPYVIDQLMFNDPHFVRVNIPHNAENMGSQERLLISIRFEREVSMEEAHTKTVLFDRVSHN